ncbi:unnamed protein product [Cuscuta epithymum]|uniref:Myb/SANT-like domain-containing protein n=1 Tax=Cuscuta epithymum TaxID=186058 RepID=A0AAV0DDV7_9ASTE|nr:unnamed protein product [Cuscuta epithymum]
MEDCTITPPSSKVKRNNHQWSPHEDKILIEGCLELINQGWKAENGFKTGFYQQLQKWMATKIPGCHILGDPNIKNRLRHLKTQYKEFSMMRGASGFGWNEETKMVNCDDEVWASWIKGHKESVHLRHKSFPYYDDLAIIFGAEWATGDKCESPAEMVTSLGKESAPQEGAHVPKSVVHDDFFGVAVDLDTTNDDIFSSPDINRNKKWTLGISIKKEFEEPSKKSKKNEFDKHAEVFQKKLKQFSKCVLHQTSSLRK